MNHRYLILAISVIALLAQVRFDAYAQQAENLEPEDGLFASGLFEPYNRVLAKALLSEHGYRKCQMLIIPSRSTESAVYVIYSEKDGATKVIAKEMEYNLWQSIAEIELKNNDRKFFSVRDEEIQKALEKIKIITLRWEREIDPKISESLEGIWQTMLSRVRYENSESQILVQDGATYHVSHFDVRNGFRAGKYYNPIKGTVLADFVQLGEDLQRFAKKELAADALSKKIEQFQQRLQQKKP